MNKINFKSAFIFGSNSSSVLTRDFIEKKLNVSPIKVWSYCGRDVLDVPTERYEEVILEGQKFALENKLESTSWIDHYKELGSVGYIKLAYAFLGERQGDFIWCIKDYMPKDVLEYLKAMSKYLKTEVHQEYNQSDNALLIQPKSLNYDEQFELINEYIAKEGNGPFVKIKQMTFTGKLLNDKTYPILEK